jgi:hypothetical protein
MRQLKDGSQAQRILAHLAHGKRLTPLVALQRFKCLRPAARIHALKKRGHKIRKKIVTTNSGKRVAEYFMPAARA